MKRIFRRVLLGVFLVSLLGCCCRRCPEIKVHRPYEMPCDGALVTLVDGSDSMNRTIDRCCSILEHVKRNLVAMVETAPAGHWNLGAATFPGEYPPNAHLTLLTDQSRERMRETIQDFRAHGWDSMNQGLEFAGRLLQDDTKHKRYLMIITDGGFAGKDWDTIRSEAHSLIRKYDVYICAVGYGLESREEMMLREIVSKTPNGTPALVNVDNPVSLDRAIANTLEGFCRKPKVAIRFYKDSFISLRKGSQVEKPFELRYLGQQPLGVKLAAGGSFVTAGGSVDFDPMGVDFSSMVTGTTGKVLLTAPEGMVGDFEADIKVVDTSSNDVLDASTLTLHVVDASLSLEVLSAVVPDPESDGKLCNARLTYEVQQNTVVTLYAQVFHAGDINGREVEGFRVEPLNNLNLVAGSSQNPITFRVKLHWSDAVPPGDYTLNILATQEGVEPRVTATVDFSLP